MKKNILRLAALCVALVMTMAIAAPVYAAETASKGTITVNGTGTIKADPDIATLNIGVEITAKTPAEAQSEVAETIAKIIDALKELGLQDKDIQTAWYNMYKQYDYTRYYSTDSADYKEPEVIGYTVSHTLSVTVRELDKVGEVLEAAVEAGANQTNSVNFSVENQEALYIQALELAIKNAQTKAEALAKSMKVQIDAPIYVNETSYGNVYPIYMDGAALANVRIEEKSADSAYGVSMQAGKVEVTASVSVSYEYEK